jgi:hypothetical protein
MAKADLRKQLGEIYATGKSAMNPHLVEVPQLQYLMIDGEGDPNSPVLAQAMGALYPVAYGVKFAAKESGADFGMMPLEGLWWTDPPEAFSMDAKAKWLWTVMIVQPDWVTKSMVKEAVRAAVNKGKIDEETALHLRLETLDEGLSAQILHIGPYEAEPPTIERLHAFVAEQGYKLRNKHHEIYMGDPRRTAPERLKTIIRHPVEPG